MKSEFVAGTRPLYVTDLDGTLLGADSRVSNRSAAVLADLSARGVMVTAATARTPATADILLRGSGLTMPVVVMTGAALWDPAQRRYLSHTDMGAEAEAVTRRLMQERGLSPFVYRIDDAAGMLHTYHNGPMSRREKAFADERRNLPLKRLHFDHPDGLVHRPGTLLLFAIGEVDRVHDCADAIRATGLCSVSDYADIFNRSTGMIEVFAPGVSKAAALTRLASECGATSLTVFGDNLNDLPMMRVAGRAVAVGNAVEQVKAEADLVIGPNTADSVARFIAEDCGVIGI